MKLTRGYTTCEVDQRRIDYLAALFRAADFDDAEALLRAQALYFYQVGEYTTSLRIDPRLRDELAERRFRLLIADPGDEPNQSRQSIQHRMD